MQLVTPIPSVHKWELLQVLSPAYSPPQYQVIRPRFAVLPGGLVILRGYFAASSGNYVACLQLPNSVKPDDWTTHPVATHNGLTTADINPSDGRIYYYSTSNTWMCCDSIHYTVNSGV